MDVDDDDAASLKATFSVAGCVRARVCAALVSSCSITWHGRMLCLYNRGWMWMFVQSDDCSLWCAMPIYVTCQCMNILCFIGFNIFRVFIVVYISCAYD